MDLSSPLFEGQLVYLASIKPDQDAEIESHWTRDAEFQRLLGKDLVRPLSPAQIKKNYIEIEKEMDKKGSQYYFTIRRVTHMAGQTFFALIYSLIFSSIILAVTVVLFDIDLSDANMFGGTLMLIVGSLSFIGIGIMGSILPLLFPERGTQMTHVIIAVLLLISGVYYPISVLPEFLQKLSVLSPATYVLDGTRLALLEGTPTLELWPFIWPTLIMGLLAIPIGLWVFGLAERYAKRTGKLHRNG